MKSSFENKVALVTGTGSGMACLRVMHLLNRVPQSH